jgi:hypothetical protein
MFNFIYNKYYLTDFIFTFFLKSLIIFKFVDLKKKSFYFFKNSFYFFKNSFYLKKNRFLRVKKFYFKNFFILKKLKFKIFNYCLIFILLKSKLILNYQDFFFYNNNFFFFKNRNFFYKKINLIFLEFFFFKNYFFYLTRVRAKSLLFLLDLRKKKN